MAAGSIPVIVWEHERALPFTAELDWSSLAVVLHVSELGVLGPRLHAAEARAPTMRKAIRAAMRTHFNRAAVFRRVEALFAAWRVRAEPLPAPPPRALPYCELAVHLAAWIHDRPVGVFVMEGERSADAVAVTCAKMCATFESVVSAGHSSGGATTAALEHECEALLAAEINAQRAAYAAEFERCRRVDYTCALGMPPAFHSSYAGGCGPASVFLARRSAAEALTVEGNIARTDDALHVSYT